MQLTSRVIRVAVTLLGLHGGSVPAFANGNPGWTGTGIGILSMGSGSDGNLIFTDTSFAEGFPESNTLRVDDSQPNLNRIWTLASMAIASGWKVQFYLSGTCLGRGAEVTDIRVFPN
jgi:hypothetical protein